MEQDEQRRPPAVTAGQPSAMETYMVRLYTGPLSTEEFVSIEADKTTTATDILRKAVRKLRLGNPDSYEIAEVLTSGGQLCKERRLEGVEHPVCIQLLWRRDHTDDAVNGSAMSAAYRFYIRKKDPDYPRPLGWMDSRPVDHFLVSFLVHPTSNREYPDLCNLPDLNERTLLENLRARFRNSNIYTYVGSILIALNPFKFFPIYNPKYVKMYQNQRLGELPPHIFAIADAAYHTMLRSKQNQCIVISGESGSGKTESTNLLLHHLTALSHKGLHGSGVEQTILGAGPVLEAFGNAKTVHNNNSSRFGKFIQVNYKENGMVHGAIVEKYLLEKTRIVSQAKDERNYHVFYYLLAGATEEERRVLELKQPADYFYLSQSSCFQVENPDDEEFQRLKQSMEMVGFSQETQRRIFSVLSAVLHLGNIEFRKKGEQHRDESVAVKNDSCVFTISNLLKVKERTLIEALTQKKTVAGDETVVINYRMEDAVATRDAMAKCLYGALFDWIVLKVNQALLAKKHNSEHQGNSIGVLDIFGFEDFGNNSFEQFCINYANEHLQYYFNQHIFKLEQEEYQREGIQWKNIEFIDNTACLELFSKRNVGLFSLLDEECNFPAATNESLLSKFTHHHRNNVYYEVPQRREGAFVIVHYAGKVKYYIKDFREKNSDLIRTDIVGVLKKSSLSFVREIMGIDPVAVLRWAIVRAFFRCFFAFINAGKRHQTSGAEPKKKTRHSDSQLSDNVFSDNLLSRPGVPSTSTSRGRERVSPTNPHVEPQSACSQVQDDEDEEVIGDGEMVYQRQVASSLFSAKPLLPQPGLDPGCLPSSLESSLPESEARLIRKARKVMMKNKSFKPKPRPSLSFHDIKTLKAIASRTMFGGTRMGSKTRPPSVGVQFQWSLARLMTTLNQANPFFIRCIKSNGEKAQCVFDDEIVLRQLRYTGMLATVRIRQSGYNYRLTFEEFIQLYKILLPRGLLSSKEDVWTFLQTMDLNTENFQIGKSKVFLRESEKIHLDEALHKAIMQRVVRIQRWMKTILERQNFLRIRMAVVIVQKYVRRFMAQRQLRLMQSEAAAVRIQQYFRAYQERCRFLQLRGVIVTTQALCRGYLARRRVQELAKSFQQSPKDQPDGKTIFIRRGSRHRRVRPHGAVAPLAKQESFSDLELSPVRSPPDVPPHAALAPEQLRVIEESVARGRDRPSGLLEPEAGGEGRAQGHLSPFHRAKQQFKNLMGDNRPPRRGPGDSDEDNDESSQSPAHRPHHLGVQVLPSHPQPGGAQSPGRDVVPILPQDGSQGKRKRKKPRRNESQKTGSPNQSRTNWKIARTTQWQYPADLVINELSELQALDEFIGKKYQATCDAAPKAKRMNVIDKVFKGSIEDFRKELKALISVEAQHKEVLVRYRDLLEKFEEIVWASVKREHLSDSQFPTPMIINSFRSFLDEFRKRKKEKKKDDKKVQERVRRDKGKKEKDAIQEHMGHKFMLMQFNIPTFCELCNNLMWIMEKGQVCQVCKFTCHKKCLVKATPCKGMEVKVANGTESFGVPLERQVSGDMLVPSVPERLINAIETHGMFTEGVYRKSGAVQKARMLKNILDTDPKSVNLDEYQVHVIATTLKSYLRELPEPLLTFELYDDFLRAAEIKDERERIQSLFAVIKRLPKVNYALFERLIFHLARVSMHQDSNKMTPEGLAIIFAPCLLRCKEIQVQDAMKNVNRQNLCIEYILSEQLKRVKMTLEDINTLESAENTASERLSRVRQSMRTPKAARPVSRHESLNIVPLKEDEDEEQLKEEEKVLSNHIKSIHEERNCLTYKLPVLEPRQASSDEDALTGDECDSVDLVNDDDNNEEFASSFDFPASHFGASYAALAAASDEAESSDSSEAAP